MTHGFPTTDFYCFQRRVLLNLWHLWGPIQTKSDEFYVSHQHEKLENESVARALENVSRKMDRFKNALFYFVLV